MKDVEVARIPCVEFKVDSENKTVYLIGCDLYRSFADLDELKRWRESSYHVFIKRPQNIVLRDGQEVGVRIVLFRYATSFRYAVSFAPIECRVEE